MGNGEQLLVVTTQSRLRGPWQLPSMLTASLRIRRQLAADHDVVRWATVVAGPTEFWTITVWRSRHHMQESMRSGAHDDIMWLFSKWLRSFWLMRWRPGATEIGSWDGPRPESKRSPATPQAGASRSASSLSARTAGASGAMSRGATP